jgi:hypothetical protein
MCRLRSLRSRKAAYTVLRAVDEVDGVDGGRCAEAGCGRSGEGPFCGRMAGMVLFGRCDS